MNSFREVNVNLSLLGLEFRTSQPLGNKFNVYIDGKPVPAEVRPLVSIPEMSVRFQVKVGINVGLSICICICLCIQ